MDKKTLYSLAYAHYESGHYDDAADLFTQLTLLDPQESLYWQGLASARQMGQKYQAALYAWGFAAYLSEEDPLPHFHAAECYISLEKKEEATKALEAAARLVTDDIVLQNRIGLLKEVAHGTR
jgi:type III secretion system low calcium response chaperone LcrH/SycD